MAGMVTARAWQTVRPHIPLIKFRKGGLPRDDPRTGSSGSSGGSGATAASTPPKKMKSAVALPVLEDYELPARYQRKPLEEKEMEYINRGGPE